MGGSVLSVLSVDGVGPGWWGRCGRCVEGDGWGGWLVAAEEPHGI